MPRTLYLYRRYTRLLLFVVVVLEVVLEVVLYSCCVCEKEIIDSVNCMFVE